MADIDFRTGDVLEIFCPFTEARVAGVSAGDVSIRWPWWRNDADVEWIDWNGNVAIAGGPDTPGWSNELFRTEPPAELLQVGADCRVGIPPTVVHVIEVQRFDPPLETGRLPRPHREIVVLTRGVSEDLNAVEQGIGLNPDDDIPLMIRLVFRPYAFLDLGDDVADRHGRAWCFDGPWEWRAYDGQGGTPAWPLTLLTGGDGLGDAKRSATVSTATQTGSHEIEVERWRRAAHAEPPVR
ncbi:hypothetical protein [Couchioplanes caeruleus]|uniref:Uncharacterized protein n=2 Tax=Couchioplanes caeruleus TaxID=56438 RepID=A0A1K0FMM1_9ACTN|nr:hypothetical protein [Couchioplanes caeruleus]OJF14087.1 hypothetical protein BG844_11675 [Couchioplanes caeruleus subsp. caeruleus]ROP28358.1 hypothetical protein EDD30_1108 [Couchioplanes caeruleus]